MDGIRQQIEKVLGKSGEEGATVDGEDEMVVDDTDKDQEVSRGFWAGVWDSITQSSPDHNAKSLKEANNGRLRQYASGGTFGLYLGFEPIFKKSPDVDNGLASNLLREGSGEYGRLVTSYTWNMYREMKGYAEADTAVWDKRVWDDSGSWFKAPTIKGIVDMGVTIAATVMTGGAGGGVLAAISSAGIGLIDDAAFAVLDVGGGHKKWEQAGLDFSKKTLTAAVGVGVGGVFNGFGIPQTGTTGSFWEQGLKGTISNTGFGGVLAKTALTGAQTMTTSLASSAINAFQWDEGGFGWSSDAFASGMGGGILSSATGMTSGLVSGGMNLGLEGFTGKVYENGSSLSDFVGGLSGQALNYALTGDAAFNVANFSMFGLKDVNKKLVSQGLLELHLGNDGMSMNLGSGGMDASVGTIAKAVAGFEAWGVNANMLFSGQDEAAKYASALRTLYSAGSAASDERNLYERILAGQTNIVETGSDEYNAWTNYDASSGTHTISLGSDAIADGSRFGMNIHLAHEAYRNGIDDGDEGQEQERNRAVIGHIQAAEALGATYGLGSLSGNQLAEVAALQAAYKGDASGLSGIMGRYDSSKDFWKLLVKADGTHELIDDNSKALTVTYLDEKGREISSMVPVGQDVSDVGWAESLGNVVGLDRAASLLGGNLNDMSIYDNKTLKDVLGLSDSQIIALRNDPGISLDSFSISDKQRISLAGEALLKRSGASWDDKKGWVGKDRLSLTLTDRNLQGQGNLYAWLDNTGSYKYGTATMTAFRDPKSYFVRSSKDGIDTRYTGLDSIMVTQYDLEGTVTKQQAFDGWTTVNSMIDKSYGFKKFRSMPYSSIYGGHGTVKVGPETIAEGVATGFILDKRDNTNYGLSIGDPYLRSVYGGIIAGSMIKRDGSTSLSPLSIVMHPTANFGNTGCWVTGNLGGTTGVDRFKSFTSYLMDQLGLSYGYVLTAEAKQKTDPYLRVGR